MRLSLKKRLKPFHSFRELAEALDLTIPTLKRRIRELDEAGVLSVQTLSEGTRPQLVEEEIFELFHQTGRCLVCGDFMTPPARRDIGWGEFKQCATCDFSAHEMANFKTRKQAALEQLARMISESQKTEAVLRARAEHCHELRQRRSL